MRQRSLGWFRLGLLSLTLVAGTTMFQASPKADGEGLCNICGAMAVTPSAARGRDRLLAVVVPHAPVPPWDADDSHPKGERAG